MKKQTLGTMFAELRAENGLTMLEIAQKCGLSETVVWHLEHGWSVRWETVHQILTISFRILPGSDTYEAMNLLWIDQRKAKAEGRPATHGKSTMTKHATEVVRKFRNLVRDLNPEDAKKVLDGAKRAAKALAK